MKKSILLVSLAAIASSAFADVPVAGTADAPAYYTIKANRGVPFLSYSAEGKTTGNYTTHLYRDNSLSTAGVWEVSAGKAEGAVTIKSTVADAYLLNFFNAFGAPSVASNSVANTVAEPTDLFLKDMGNGAYAISLNNPDGGSWPSDLYTLDATGGASIFAGNYVPDTGGACWHFTKIEVGEGQTIEEVLFSVSRQDAIAQLTPYKETVPCVAPAIDQVISVIEKVTPAEGVARLNELVSMALENANSSLWTCLDNQTVAIYSLRRKANNVQSGPFLYANAESNNIQPCVSTESQLSHFVFKSVGNEGGYVVYNEATKSYISTERTLVADQTEAQVVYPVLLSNSGFTGIAFPFDASRANCNGWNIDQRAETNLVQYAVADGGSIWGMLQLSSSAVDALEVENTDVREGIYDLYGRKLNAPVKGINIINGKKVVVK